MTNEKTNITKGQQKASRSPKSSSVADTSIDVALTVATEIAAEGASLLASKGISAMSKTADVVLSDDMAGQAFETGGF